MTVLVRHTSQLFLSLVLDENLSAWQLGSVTLADPDIKSSRIHTVADFQLGKTRSPNWSDATRY